MKDEIDEGLEKIKKLKEDLSKKGNKILKSKEVKKLKKNLQAAGDNLLKNEGVQKFKENIEAAGKKINKDKSLKFFRKIPKEIFFVLGGTFILYFLFSGVNSYENIYRCETNIIKAINLDIDLRSGEEKVIHYGVKELAMELDIIDNNPNYIKLRDHFLGYKYTFFKKTNNLVLDMPAGVNWSYNCIIK